MTVESQPLAVADADGRVEMTCPACDVESLTVVKRRLQAGADILVGTQLLCACGWSMELHR